MQRLLQDSSKLGVRIRICIWKKVGPDTRFGLNIQTLNLYNETRIKICFHYILTKVMILQKYINQIDLYPERKKVQDKCYCQFSRVGYGFFSWGLDPDNTPFFLYGKIRLRGLLRESDPGKLHPEPNPSQKQLCSIIDKLFILPDA